MKKLIVATLVGVGLMAGVGCEQRYDPIVERTDRELQAAFEPLTAAEKIEVWRRLDVEDREE